MLFRLLQVLLLPIILPLALIEQGLFLLSTLIINIPMYIITGSPLSSKKYSEISEKLPFILIADKLL